jgi:hypothetical protein
VGNPHHMSFPGFPPSKHCWEDDQPWEMQSQASLPSGYPPGWSHYPYLVNIFWLAYLSIILLVHSKSAATKMFEIKYEKNTRPCRTSAAFDPAKRGLKRVRNEREMLDFRPGSKRASQPIRGLIGLIATSFFGNARPAGVPTGSPGRSGNIPGSHRARPPIKHSREDVNSWEISPRGPTTHISSICCI